MQRALLRRMILVAAEASDDRPILVVLSAGVAFAVAVALAGMNWLMV